MKKVLVGMDFSQGAMNALEYSLDLCDKEESEIVLLWVEPLGQENKIVPGQKNEIRHEVKLELDQLIAEKKQNDPNLKISFKLKKGRIYKEFSSFAESGHFDLAIIGTHGIGGFEEFWIGSNAYKIISYCPCPVISVRTDFKKYGRIEKILIPIDDSIDTTKKVPMAVELAMVYDAEIQILAIYESDLPSLQRKVDHYVSDSESYMADRNVNYHFHQCKSNNTTLSIVKYAEENQSDLIVIMTDQNKATTDILVGRRAQQIINRSRIPVLSVKPFKLEIN